MNIPELKPWERLEHELVGDFRIFQLAKESFIKPDGSTHSFYVLYSSDWVNIVPITPEGRVVLIKQFRPGSMEVTIEVPGGMVDQTDNDPCQAAKRELMEETGYEAETIIKTATIRPNPAILRNRCHQFIALNARPTGQTHFDSGEYVVTFEADWNDVEKMMQDGRIDHALVLNALNSAKSFLGSKR